MHSSIQVFMNITCLIEIDLLTKRCDLYYLSGVNSPFEPHSEWTREGTPLRGHHKSKYQSSTETLKAPANISEDTFMTETIVLFALLPSHMFMLIQCIIVV